MPQDRNSTDWPVVLGNRIATARICRGITQSELAQRSGISQATVSRVESGSQPSCWTLYAICHTLQVPSDEILRLPMPDRVVSHFAAKVGRAVDRMSTADASLVFLITQLFLTTRGTGKA